MHIYKGITTPHICCPNKVMMLATIYLKVTALNPSSEIASDKFMLPYHIEKRSQESDLTKATILMICGQIVVIFVISHVFFAVNQQWIDSGILP